MSAELSRRKFLKIAAAGAVGVVAASCAPAATQAPAAADTVAPTAVPQASGKNAVLQYYIGFGAGGNPEQVDAIKKLFTSFADGSKGAVKSVEPLVVAWADAPQKFQTMVAGGTPPDMITMGMSQWDFAAKGAFVDLNPLVQADAIDLTQWDQTAIDCYTVLPKNKMLYGLPFGANDQFLVVNKTLFQKAGIPLPPVKWDDPSWTIAAFLDAAAKLTQGEGVDKVWGILGDGGNWNLPWFYGGSWVDDTLEKIIVDQRESLEGFQFHYDLIYKNKVMPNAAESAALTNGFLSGKVGMYVEGSWGVGTLMQIKDFEWDMYPIPIAPGTDLNKRAEPYYPDSLVISSKNAVNESWELLKFLLYNDDNYKEFLKIMSMIPARKALRDWFVNDFWKTTNPKLNFDVVMDGFKYAQIQRLFFNINWSEANNTQEADLSALWEGTGTVDKVIADLAPKLQDIWTRGNNQMKAQ